MTGTIQSMKQLVLSQPERSFDGNGRHGNFSASGINGGSD